MRQGFPQAYPSSDIVPNSGRLFAFVLAASALAACSSGSSGGGSGGGGSGGGGGGGGGGTPSFAVSTSAGTGGSISPPNASVSQGSTTSFSIAALPSHDLVDVSGCSGTLSGATYTTGAITAACTVTATFALKRYTVTATAGTGGIIDPASASVDHGAATQFTVTAHVGYTVDSVTGCGGALVGDTFTTGEVTDDCTVTAAFAATDTAPAQVSAVAGDEQVTVSWASVDGATSYNLYWSGEPGIHPHTPASYDAFEADVTSPHVVSGLVNDEDYFFVVTALFDAVEGDSSAEISARPTAAIGSGNLRTLTHIIDVTDGALRQLHQVPGNAFALVEDQIYVIPGGGTRELWSFRPETGEVRYVMEAGDHSTTAAGRHLLKLSPDGELIAMSGSTTFVAMDLAASTLREFDNIDVATGTSADFAIASNGNILARAADNGIVVLDQDGNTLVGSGGQGTGASALASTADGRVVGIAGSVLYEFDAVTGQSSEIGALTTYPAGSGGLQATRLAATADDYFVAEARTQGPGRVLHVDGTTLNVTELALPDDVHVGIGTVLDVDAEGNLYAKLEDRRPVVTGFTNVVLRVTGEAPGIVMGYANPAPRYAALGPQGDLFYTSTASGLSGRVFRQDRRTGGVTVVTSEAVDDAVLVDATVLAVVEDDVYVVSSRPEGEFLVHVDVGTGAQTELSALGAPPAGGDRWFVNTIYPDSQSDDLILGNTGGHTAQQGCCGSVTRLATAPGSVPEVITAGFGGGAPQDLKVTSDGQIYFINGNVGIYAVDRAAGTNTVLVEHPAEIGLPSAFVPLIDGTFAVFDGDYADADDNWDGHSVWKVEPGSAEAVEMLADRPSGLTFGWAHLFLVP